MRVLGWLVLLALLVLITLATVGLVRWLFDWQGVGR